MDTAFRTLTERQLQLLSFCSADLTVRDAAVRIGISTAHAYKEVQAVKAHFDVRTWHGAVAKAVRRGMV